VTVVTSETAANGDAEVVETYRRCLNARRAYQRGCERSGGVEDALQRELQYAVLDFWEVLHPQLSKRSIAVKHPQTDRHVADAWEDAPLYIVGHDESELAACPACGFQTGTEFAGQTCAKCGEAQLQQGASETPIWRTGLKHLREWHTERTSQTTQVTGDLGDYEKTSEHGHIYDAETLFRVARYLDQTASELGFITTAPMPEGDPQVV